MVFPKPAFPRPGSGSNPFGGAGLSQPPDPDPQPLPIVVHGPDPSSQSVDAGFIRAEESVLVVIDIQDRLCPVTDNPRMVLVNAVRLLRAANWLGVPVVVTEQYPQGLGPTMPDLRHHLEGADIVEKTTFAATGSPQFQSVMDVHRDAGRTRPVIIGMEAHVCVLQSALGLLADGARSTVVTDACSSRTRDNAQAAWVRMAQAGVTLSTTEMVLFEWLGSKENPQFSKVLRELIR